MRSAISAAVMMISALVAAHAHAEAPGQLFRPAGSIAAPDGRWDLATWDREHRRLLVAHGQDVLIVDPEHADAVRAIGKIEGAHAALAIPGTNHVLVTSGRDDSVRILNAADGQELARILVAANPDAAILSSDGRLAYVMDAKAGVVSVVDLRRNTEVTRISLQPGLELPVLVNRTIIAVNNEDRSEIEFADLATGKAAGALALTGCEGPTGLAIDPASHLALSACGNGKAALVNLARKKVIELVPIGAGPDTVIWDAAHHRFLVPCGRSGTLSVIALVHGHAIAAAPAVTETSARTAALDPDSGRVYLPAARFQPAAPGQRPMPAPGSFHIVVLAPTP